MQAKLVFILFMILSLVLPTSFSKQRFPTGNLLSEDKCVDWEKDAASYIEFRWCWDGENDYTKYYQFHNRYDFEVHILYTLYFTNGSRSEGGVYVDAGENSDDASTLSKTPTRWEIRKKERKNQAGLWESF